MISLTSNLFNNIERINFHEFEKDFLFIVNGKIYQTNSFVANILSPSISKNYKEKVKTSYYEINTKHQGDFNKIIEYGEMKSINISKEERKYFIDILKQLGNRQECAQFYEELEEDISYENVINRILIKQELDIQFEEEISFISNNFHSFYTKYPESISTLDVNIIERIISNDEMKLNNEEELFDLILELYDKSKEYSILFSYVNFNNLSIESIKKFTHNFDINDINSHIWKNIRQRLEQDISHQKSHQDISTQTIEPHHNYIRGHSTHLRVIIGLQKFNIILYDNHVIKIYIFFIKKISRNKKIIFNILQYFFDLSCPLLWIYNNKHII